MIREAQNSDMNIVSGMFRFMIEEMALHGGYSPSTNESDWRQLTDDLMENRKSDMYQYLVATSKKTEKIIACTAGKIIMLTGVYMPKKILHISAVYVLEAYRRTGVASQLIETLMCWGKAAECQACELNVGIHNPAKGLYEKHQFKGFRLKMTRSL